MIDLEMLRYYAEYEQKGHRPAADAAMFTLEREGLLVCLSVGWGHYEVRLTDKGRAMLGSSE